MRNLFVCHTQAQLILACGLSLGRFKEAENHLILFQDFLLEKELIEHLDRVFTKNLYLQGIYLKEWNTYKEKLRNYPINDRKMKEMMLNSYDRVFTVCDTIYPEQSCMKLAYRLNKNTEFCCLEDGIMAYYQNVVIRGGLDSNLVLRFIRKLYFKYVKNLGRFYDSDFNEFGGLKYNKTIYCLYPKAVREPYRSQRNILGIWKDEFLLGLKAMYAKVDLPVKGGDIILVVDKINTYVYPEKVKASLSGFIEESKTAGKKVFCKFHPRETETWSIFDGCDTLENTIGIESLYLSLADQANNITIVGIKSTGLMSAKILGYNPISLFNSCGEKNPDLVNFFEVIGIELK